MDPFGPFVVPFDWQLITISIAGLIVVLGFLTIVTSKQVDENRLESVKTYEVEGDGTDPRYIKVSCCHTSLEHRLKLDGQWERKFYYIKVLVFPFEMSKSE